MNSRLLTVFSTLTILIPGLVNANPPAAAPADAPPVAVQVALLLDTSSSMEGLISQAQAQLWEVINTFNGSHQQGCDTTVEVALYEYGNSGLKDTATWIRQVHPFTRDLDSVSESLFALRTNGGEEYCGAVIQRAVDDLQWSAADQTCRVIFIAGNEPFNQGSVNPAEACRSAAAKSVIVNTLHCGPVSTGNATQWNTGELVASGKYFAIDQHQAVAEIPAPQDAELARLNLALNATYIAYGTAGNAGREKQTAQDQNAGVASSVAKRVASKASVNYCNSHWDLVDAAREKTFDLSKVAAEQLPAELRAMTFEQLRTHIAMKEAERAALQKRIQELVTGRAAWLAANTKKPATDDSLGSRIRAALREQAAPKGIVWKN